MKLIDILVEELPKRGGWPDGVCEISTHASGRAFFDGRFAPRGFSLPMASDAWSNYKHPRSYTNAVTSEQYEAALAAKKEGWIDWVGGECPVEKGTLVDVRYRNGEENHRVGAGIPFDDTGSNHYRNATDWENDGNLLDIIAYRLHQPKEVAQTEAEQEADLNDCIGQTPATVWNGDGLPPVGCVCERSWAGDKWLPCEILFASNQIVVVKLKGSGMEDAYNIGDVTFRPIRTEAERKRDEATQALCDAGGGNGKVDEKAGYGSCWFDVYDAIAAGKVPGIKLED